MPSLKARPAMVTSPSVPRDIGLVLGVVSEPVREDRLALAPEPGEQDRGREPSAPGPDEDQPGQHDRGDVAAERGPLQECDLAPPRSRLPSPAPTPGHARHQRRPTSVRSSSWNGPRSAAGGLPDAVPAA